MDNNNQRQKVSLIGRILSMEALLLLMGLASLVYGIINSIAVNIFFGLIIIPGVFFLAKVRKKDWKKHWEDLETEQQARIEHGKQSKHTDDPPEK